MTCRAVIITNTSDMELRVAVVFRECDLISSQDVRRVAMSYSSSRGSETSGQAGFDKLSGSFTAKRESSYSSSTENHNESKYEFHWNDFIVPGSVIMKPKTKQRFTVINDKPVHYLTIVDPKGDRILCEHLPTDATRITINEYGLPDIPDDDDESIKPIVNMIAPTISEADYHAWLRKQ